MKEKIRLVLRWFFDYVVFWPFTLFKWLYPDNSNIVWGENVVSTVLGVLFTVIWLILVLAFIFSR